MKFADLLDAIADEAGYRLYADDYAADDVSNNDDQRQVAYFIAVYSGAELVRVVAVNSQGHK